VEDQAEKIEKKDEGEGPRSFVAFLRCVDGGSFEVELADELHKMNEELQQIASQVGKATGELTVSFKFKHEAKGQVDVLTDLKVKMPKVQRARSVFWVTRGFNLTDKNPRQADLPFRDVNKKATPARDVAPSEARAARSV